MAKRGNPAWAKGVSGNPSGGKTGAKHAFTLEALTTALRKVEADKKINMLEYAWERALKSDVVLLALLRKYISDSEPAPKQEDDELINNTLEFKDIPENGKGMHRFERFIHK
jgi:hypothetical protein